MKSPTYIQSPEQARGYGILTDVLKTDWFDNHRRIHAAVQCVKLLAEIHEMKFKLDNLIADDVYVRQTATKVNNYKVSLVPCLPAVPETCYLFPAQPEDKVPILFYCIPWEVRRPPQMNLQQSFSTLSCPQLPFMSSVHSLILSSHPSFCLPLLFNPATR